nr:hypothetical protein [Tanacetum cinerariifolium]
MAYLLNISKMRAFWSLNEDILKITILTTNMPYPSRNIWRIRACTHQIPQRKQAQYAVSRKDQYAILEIYRIRGCRRSSNLIHYRRFRPHKSSSLITLPRSLRREFKDIVQLLSYPENGNRRENQNSSTKKQTRDDEFLCTEKAREDNVQQYVLFLLWSSGSKNSQNTDGDDAFEVKELEFKGKNPESEVHVSLSSKFEDFSNNNINEINVADSLVPAAGQILTNNTNTFSAAGPSNTVVSPTHRKSSYMDPSQYSDDLNTPALEDITYSNDEEDNTDGDDAFEVKELEFKGKNPESEV